MRRPILLLLTAALFTAVSLPALQSQPQEQPKEKKKPRKVWTEEDLAGLGGRINVVGSEAPPEPAAQPATAAARPDDALWKELDDLRAEREMIQGQIELNQRSVASITEKLNTESDPVSIDELLELRAWQEEQVTEWEVELERVNTRIAELEKLTAGRKRPPKPAPVKTEKPRPAAPAAQGEGEAPAEPPPAEEPSEEEPPPPPPAS